MLQKMKHLPSFNSRGSALPGGTQVHFELQTGKQRRGKVTKGGKPGSDEERWKFQA